MASRLLDQGTEDIVEVWSAYMQEMGSYNLLDASVKEVTTVPEKPELWTCKDVALNKDLMTEYHNSSEEEKEGWRRYLESKKAPENNKKDSTEATYDCTVVNRRLMQTVSLNLHARDGILIRSVRLKKHSFEPAKVSSLCP